jgi:hypothetical protein
MMTQIILSTSAFNLPEGYEPTDGELNNLVYLILKYTAGWAMREVDFQVMLTMVAEESGIEKIGKIIDNTCEYAWDHILGEPDEFTPEQMKLHVMPGLVTWYGTTTREQRASIE